MKDAKVLEGVKIKDTTYKLKDGLATNSHTELVEKLRQYLFSTNMKEYSTGNNKKVFSVLVSFYDEEKERSVVEHYSSIECVVVNVQVLFNSIENLFELDSISWHNLVSDLSDSTNYMRGKKSGLETKLREKQPNLLDIDGDICHHIHNAVKNFCSPFDDFVEN